MIDDALGDTVHEYFKKSDNVHAVRWLGHNWKIMSEFISFLDVIGDDEYSEDMDILVKTVSGENRVRIGDYVLKDAQGEYYLCKSGDFDNIYERIERV